MNKAGGIVSIIAGIFGVIAAIATLFVGGMGSAFQANQAEQVIGLGWGGVFFSFLVIIFGAIAFSRPKFSGIAIIISSVFGIVLGGTLVAICMALSIIGGILTLFGKNDRNLSLPSENIEAQSEKKKSHWGRWIFGISTIFLLLILIAGHEKNSTKIDPIAELEKESPSDLSPSGELADIFSFGSQYTDLQRENKLKEITGKVVQWELPVFDVKRSGDGYKVQTQNSAAIFPGSNFIGAFITFKPRSEQEKQLIEALKTGDVISFKGRISDSTMRNLEIDPAILVFPESSPQPAGTTSELEHVDQTEMERSVQGEIVNNQKLHTPTSDQSSASIDITGNWIGNTDGGEGAMEIKRSATGVNVVLNVANGTGCSGTFESSGSLSGDTLILTKKEDDQTCTVSIKFSEDTAEINEEHCIYYHGASCGFDGVLNKITGNTTNAPTPQEADKITRDEANDAINGANDRINAVWNATTKEIRKSLLPEQRQWLKQRENDCSVKATTEAPDNVIAQDTIRFKCMTEMTDQRTETLKVKIASLTK